MQLFSKKKVEPKKVSNHDLIRDFNYLYYHGNEGRTLYSTTSWLGVPTLKCPTDTWIYQEILHRTRPEVIFETGVHAGGSALYLATICDAMGIGEIHAVDISLKLVHDSVKKHPRIHLYEASSIDLAVLEKFKQIAAGKKTMVILDSDHSESHVSQELAKYAPLVSKGCYLICEDTNINGHPAFPDFGPGPFEAVDKFLMTPLGNQFEVDKTCERLLMTFNPNGYLLRH